MDLLRPLTLGRNELFFVATVMAAVDGLRSAYARVGGLVYFGRMLDKIRLADQNKLPAGYNLGDQVPTWFDGNCCRFLHVEYPQIVNRVRLGHSDEQDKAAPSLNRWKSELGFKDRTDIETFFDLYDADEGREIRADYSPD
jgi:hypothetical protein